MGSNRQLSSRCSRIWMLNHLWLIVGLPHELISDFAKAHR
jgi:hypothetical protein